MSLVTSRRSLILGMTGLVACPMIARASSLMHLRGDVMDEWLVVFELGSTYNMYTVSQFGDKDPTYGARLYERTRPNDKFPHLMSMSLDPRKRVRQLNLIRPYPSIQYLAMTKSDFNTANEFYRLNPQVKL